MWDAFAKVLTNSNALLVLVFFSCFIIILIILTHTGLVNIHTSSFHMGSDHRERDIIRQQIQWSHIYIMGLESQIKADTSKYNGYFTKYILECVYDEVIDWITFNHINLDSDYIAIKQAKMKAIVRSFDIAPEFRTEKFERKIDKWTEEIIRKLVVIRDVYK